MSKIPFIKADIERLIKDCDKRIFEAIDNARLYNATRDDVSKRILTSLDDLCTATILLNAVECGYKSPDLRVAWEVSLLNNSTRFLSDFLQMLKYVGRRIPQDGRNERLMLKYYDYLWGIRKFLAEHNIDCLRNLDAFPRKQDEENTEYYNKIAAILDVEQDEMEPGFSKSRYFIENKTIFYAGKERYFELTLQLAGKYASKFNRITVYTKTNIGTPYSIQIAYSERQIKEWQNDLSIKILTNWKVSVDPSILNRFAAILGKELKISSNFGEYKALMTFLTKTGMSLLDFIDIKKEIFDNSIKEIFDNAKTSYLKDILIKLYNDFHKGSRKIGKNTIRYLLLRMKEENVQSVFPIGNDKLMACSDKDISLSARCLPFERSPLLANFPHAKTNCISKIKDLARVVDNNDFADKLPYFRIKGTTEFTGEIYIDRDEVLLADNFNIITDYNHGLSQWDKEQGFSIRARENDLYIDGYENFTVRILNRLIERTKVGNQGQKQLNLAFIKDNERRIWNYVLKIRAHSINS